MTDPEVAAATVTVQHIEAEARAYWDAIGDGRDAAEYQAVMGVVRQAGALRKSLEQWIVTRATHAARLPRATGAAHG